MALKLADRVRETTTSIGTGNILLGGTVTGYQTFSSVLNNADQTYYTIANSYQWEVGLGTYNSSTNTLARTSVLASSNGGSLVNFDTGTKDIFIDYPASTAVYKTTSGRVSIGSIFNNYNPNATALYLDGVNGTQLGLGVNNTQHSYISSGALSTTLATSGATPLYLGASSTIRFAIASTGQVAVGSVSVPPTQYALSVYSSTAIGSSNGAYIYNPGYDTGLNLSGVNAAGSLLTSANGIELSATTAAKSLVFKTVSTERMRIDASGNVGIGNTPSGSYKLEVTGGIGATNFTVIGFSPPTNGMYLVTTNTLGFSTNSTTRLVIGATGDATFSGAVSAASVTATGNATAAALIPSGTTAPANGMYLVSAAPPILGFSVNSTLCGFINTSGTFQTGGNGLVDAYGYTLRSYASGPPTYGITSPGGTSLAFSANGVNRMYITSAGDVGIGITLPTTKLDVAGGVKLGSAGTDTITLTGQVSANSSVGTAGQVLTSRGANLSPEWTTAGGGSTVGSSILYGNGSGGFSNATVSTGLSFTSGSLALANTAVTAGSYGTATQVPAITVDAQGRITAASNTSIAIAASQVTSGTLAIARGGTNGAATPTAGGVPYGTGTAYAFTAAGTAGQVLTSNGTSAPTWTNVGGTGTVTAVSVVSANGLAGTSSGGATPALTLSTTVGTGAAPVLLKGNGTAISAATSGTDYAPATSGSSILYGNGAGGFSNVTIGSGLNFVGGTLSSTSSGGTITGSGTTNYVPKFSSSTAIGNSVIYDDGTNIGVGTALPTAKLDVSGAVKTTGGVLPRAASSANQTSPWAWSSDSYDIQSITALANALVINADAGTPVDGQKTTFRIKDNGTARALTWTTGTSKSFRAIGVTLPTTTVISKTVYIGCIYNGADSRWDVVAVAQEA